MVRDWRTDDRDSLVLYANNRSVWRNMEHYFPHPYTREDADAWVDFLSRTPEATHWAIEVDARAVGGIGVDLGKGIHEKSGYVGYWLGEPYWGRGIMTAAVRATSAHVMARFGLARLEARVYAWNPASMRVLEKCGFVREGVLRRSVYRDQALIDSMLYALVSEKE